MLENLIKILLKHLKICYQIQTLRHFKTCWMQAKESKTEFKRSNEV